MADSNYLYDLTTGEYVLKQEIGTALTPPEPKQGFARIFNGTAWEYVEDHRQVKDQDGNIISGSGTPYWLPGDTYATEARYMTTVGALPATAILTQPEKPADVVKAEQVALYVAAVQKRLDTFAQTRNYDNIFTACTYATSTNTKFSAEGLRCISLRDATWAKCYEVLAAVDAGTRTAPTIDELLAELPALTWES